MKNRRWRKQHKEEIEQFWERFVKLAFTVDERPELLDDNAFAKEFFALADIGTDLIIGEKVEFPIQDLYVARRRTNSMEQHRAEMLSIFSKPPGWYRAGNRDQY